MNSKWTALVPLLGLSLAGCARVEYDSLNYPLARASTEGISVSVAFSGNLDVENRGLLSIERRGNPYSIEIFVRGANSLRVESSTLRIDEIDGAYSIIIEAPDYNAVRSAVPELLKSRIEGVPLPGSAISMALSLSFSDDDGTVTPMEFMLSSSPVRVQRSAFRFFELLRGV